MSRAPAKAVAAIPGRTPGSVRSGRWWWPRAILPLVVSLAGSVNLLGAGDPAPLRFGFSTQVFVDVNENDARAALKGWAQTLGRQRNIPVNPVLEFFDSTAAIKTALEARTVDAVSMTTMEFWALRHSVPVSPTIILGSAAGQTADEYVLLVHRDNPATRLADLRGQNVLVIAVARESLASVWLETVLLDQHLGTMETFWGRSVNVGKVSRVILPVFFRQADACVVTREGFRTMTELNPQLGRQLKVLAQSPALVPGMFCFRSDLASPYRDKLIADTGQVTDTVAGRQTLNLFRSNELVVRPISDLDQTCALLDRHERLLTEARALAKSAAGGALRPPVGEGRP